MLKGRKILDDAAMLAGGAMNLLSAGRAQVKREARDRVAAMAERLDLVPREDFERMEAMLVRLREEQEVLKKRLAALEGGADNTPPSAMQKKAGAAPTTAKTTARRGKKPS
jgi:BMFP domain-containing protein YqiC